jgi:hypothetical protein
VASAAAAAEHPDPLGRARYRVPRLTHTV